MAKKRAIFKMTAAAILIWTKPVNPQVRTKISKKHRLWTRYMETRDIKIFSKYKSARKLGTLSVEKLEK